MTAQLSNGQVVRVMPEATATSWHSVSSGCSIKLGRRGHPEQLRGRRALVLNVEEEFSWINASVAIPMSQNLRLYIR